MPQISKTTLTALLLIACFSPLSSASAATCTADTRTYCAAPQTYTDVYVWDAALENLVPGSSFTIPGFADSADFLNFFNNKKGSNSYKHHYQWYTLQYLHALNEKFETCAPCYGYDTNHVFKWISGDESEVYATFEIANGTRTLTQCLDPALSFSTFAPYCELENTLDNMAYINYREYIELKQGGSSSTSYTGELFEKEDYNYIAMSGNSDTDITGGTVIGKMTTTAWNSPYLYFSAPPAGDITVSLHSSHPLSADPTFTSGTSWQLQSDGQNISLTDQTLDHLFYQFNSSSITLPRYGRNFSTSEELLTYLTDSSFLSQLGLTPTAQANSLSYLQSQTLPTASNYYLTIVDPSVVSSISTLDITPIPDQITRRYYAIYPTTTPVYTYGDFLFPANYTTSPDAFTVSDFGEVIVTPEMIVFWSN